MNITVTGRHLSISKRLRDYAETKIKKLEKYFNQLINAHVILYVEKLDHGAEVIINGDGVQFHGRETAGTLYSAIDLLFEKMEKQINKYKEKVSSHKVTPLSEQIEFAYTSDEGHAIQLVQASNKPIDKVEAFLQMSTEERDYILFKQGISEVNSDIDLSNKSYAVLFRKNDEVKMVEVPFENIKNHTFQHNTFLEYDIAVKDASIANPKLDFNKSSENNVEILTIREAIDKIENSNDEFLPFFNIEAQYFNIIYKTSNNYEVVVPAF